MNYYSYDSTRLKNINENKMRKDRKEGRVFQGEMKLSTEITFEIFEEKFIKRWYKLMSKELSKKLSPAFLWTEI